MQPATDPGFCRWSADHMWFKGFHIFATGTKDEIEKIRFQMSRVKETICRKLKFKGDVVYMVYVTTNDFPVVPTVHYYDCLDNIDGQMLRLCDVISHYKVVE